MECTVYCVRLSSGIYQAKTQHLTIALHIVLGYYSPTIIARSVVLSLRQIRARLINYPLWTQIDKTAVNPGSRRPRPGEGGTVD